MNNKIGRLRRHLDPDEGFGRVAARGGPPFGPPWARGDWADFGPGRRGRRGRFGHRGKRGDIRTAILALLAERPMHGYEMIQEIHERSGGYWRPSPGSIYPTLQLLADEGLIADVGGNQSRRMFELTEEGRNAAQQDATPPWEQVADDVDTDEANLRSAFGSLAAALSQVSHAGTESQRARALELVNDTRRKLYAILSEDS